MDRRPCDPVRGRHFLRLNVEPKAMPFVLGHEDGGHQAPSAIYPKGAGDQRPDTLAVA